MSRRLRAGAVMTLWRSRYEIAWHHVTYEFAGTFTDSVGVGETDPSEATVAGIIVSFFLTDVRFRMRREPMERPARPFRRVKRLFRENFRRGNLRLEEAYRLGIFVGETQGPAINLALYIPNDGCGYNGRG